MQKFLVVRTDRIGDVILTLPTLKALKENFKDAEVTLLLRSYTSELADGLADTVIYDKEDKPKPFFEILNEIRRRHFDTAIVAYPRFRIALLLWLAGIPVRVGTGYRWYSFLFNKRVYEHRKTVKKHEAEYNLSLLKAIGCEIPEKPEVQLELSEQQRKTAIVLRHNLGISVTDKMIILHPGSGGSALNWKPEKFSQLATELIRQGFKVVISGGIQEAELVKDVANKSDAKVKSFISTLSLKEFAAFIQTAKLFIANSTGPLHIAASVGTPVIGFYPPIKVMSPKRWGPLTDKKILFVPEQGLCPKCKGDECKCDDRMELIKVEDVVEAAIKLINNE